MVDKEPREYKTHPGGEVLRLDNDVLLKFIADQEGRNFRTDQNTGANFNALLIWNAVRALAGLPRLDRTDLPAYCVICSKYHRDPHKRMEEQ